MTPQGVYKREGRQSGESEKSMYIKQFSRADAFLLRRKGLMVSEERFLL